MTPGLASAVAVRPTCPAAIPDRLHQAVHPQLRHGSRVLLREASVLLGVLVRFREYFSKNGTKFLDEVIA